MHLVSHQSSQEDYIVYRPLTGSSQWIYYGTPTTIMKLVLVLIALASACKRYTQAASKTKYEAVQKPPFNRTFACYFSILTKIYSLDNPLLYIAITFKSSFGYQTIWNLITSRTICQGFCFLNFLLLLPERVKKVLRKRL